MPKGCVIDEGNILERKDCLVRWKGQSFKYALENIFSGILIPGGISLSFEAVGEQEKILEADPQSYIVKDLLNDIVKVDPRYQWKEVNGVINIWPSQDYSILDAKISEFKFDKEFPSELRKKLVQNTVFQDYLKKNNLIDQVPDPDYKHGYMFSIWAGKPNPRYKISIDLKNATVREILNEIVRQSGDRTWSYREYDLMEDGTMYHLYRLEINL